MNRWISIVFHNFRLSAKNMKVNIYELVVFHSSPTFVGNLFHATLLRLSDHPGVNFVDGNGLKVTDLENP